MTYFRSHSWVVLIFVAFVSSLAHSSETDQFMVWNVELEDSAPALNGWLNEQLDEYIVLLNSEPKWRDASIDEVAIGYYRHLFKHLLNQEIRAFLREGEGIHEYPRREDMSVWQFQEASVFRGRSFPYYLPMARTIRLGDVYLGTDKVSHMMGYGRRYFKKYSGDVGKGVSPFDAEDKQIRWGLRRELSVVGRWVDGIVSYADMEANYQGMRMAIEMSSGEAPLFGLRDGNWVALREMDILPYITPDLDETWNNNHYWLLRKWFVLPLLRDEYVDHLYDDGVQARFEVYRGYTPSRNRVYIDEYWATKKRNPRKKQSLETIYRVKQNGMTE